MISSSPFKFSLLSFYLSLTFGVSMVSAQEVSTGVKTLEMIQAAEDKEGTEVNTSTYNKATLEKAAVSNWSDFNKRVDPSVEFNAQKRSITIRGDSGARVVVLEDGIPIPYVEEFMVDRLVSGGYGGHQTVNFDTVNSVDVTKGPGAADSNSIAGTVSLQSLRPSDLLTGDKSIGFRVKGTYSSLDNSWSPSLSTAFRITDKISALVSYTYKTGDETPNMAKVGGVGNTRLKVNPETVKSNRGLFRLEANLAPGHALDLGASFIRDRNTMLDLYQMGPRDAYLTKSSDNNVDRKRVWLGYQYKNSQRFTGFDSASAQLYWQDFTTEVRDNIVLKTLQRGVNGLNLGNKTYGLNLGFSGTLGSEAFSSTWNYSVRASRTKATQALVRTTITDNLIPNATGTDITMMLSNTFSWNNGKVELTPGVRYDYFSRSPSAMPGKVAPAKAKDSAFSPSLMLSVKPIDELTLYARYAKGFRAPTVAELYYDYVFSVYTFKGDPNLKPERSYGIELGAKWASENLQLGLNYFEQHYRNHIAGVMTQPRRGQRRVDFRNYSKARIRGVEGSFRWEFVPDWYARGAFTYSEGIDQVTNRPLSSSVPFKGIIGLGYDNGHVGVDVGMSMARPHNRVDRATNFKIPSYNVFDVSAYWKPQAVKGLHLQVNVSNLFNKKYWNASSQGQFANNSGIDFYTQPGRNVSVNVQYQF